jgi:glutamyl-tRNA synthetase
MLDHLHARLDALQVWSAASVEQLVKAVCDEKGTKTGNVAQPLRVAVSGSTISPAIGETLVLLGRESTLTRIQMCLKLRDVQPTP